MPDKMSPAAWMALQRKRQGLPPTIEDPATLARLALLLNQPKRKAAERALTEPRAPTD